MANPEPIEGLSDLVERYDVILCDVWGVLHNGKRVWETSARALANARDEGLAVVMITNAPRPRGPVLEQLDNFGCPPGVFDALVTSGDVTRRLIGELNGPIYHVGPERDFALYEGLDTTFAYAPDGAAGIVCTGLFDDRGEHPHDYLPRMKQWHAMGLPFVCANPDIVVEVGDELLWCAGALAREYIKLGGDTRIVGKPHAPIYDVALEKARDHMGRKVERSRVLAIGDGLPTDIKGAQDNDLDALFISRGIHAAEYANGQGSDGQALERFLEKEKAAPRYWMHALQW